MATTKADPEATLRDAARSLGDVDEGTSCSQTSFKVGGKPFLYVGQQGGRSKAMFKLDASLAQAETMAAAAPDDVQIGKHGWVTARFTAAQPLPARTWKRWLKESYALAAKGG